MIRKVLLAAGVTAMAVLPGAPDAGASTQHVINIAGFTFSPNVVTVQVGDTVVWNNVAPNAPHNAFRNAPFAMSTEDVDGGQQTAPIVATEAGTFPYYCAIHGIGMSGTLIVEAGTEIAQSRWPIGLALGGAAAAGALVLRSRRRPSLAV